MATLVFAKSPWVVPFAPRASASVRLFCFPHAGGSASTYRDWAVGLPSVIEVCAVELPGRGTRIREPLVDSLDQLITAVSDALLPYLDGSFVFFGHSMGGLVAFELARALRRQCRAMPLHLFLSACTPPHRHDRISPIHSLPDAELIAQLKRLNGSCPDVLEDADLQALMLPIIRNDLKLVDTYRYSPGPPLDCSLTIYGGHEDAGVPAAWLEEWRRYSSGRSSVRIFPGDHFFIAPHKATLLNSIALAIQFLL